MKINANQLNQTMTQPKVCPTCGTCPTCGSKHPQTGFMPNWPYTQTVLQSQQGQIQPNSLQYENIN